LLVPFELFKGNGENVPNLTESNANEFFFIGAQGSPYQVSIAFAFSSDGGASFQVPIILCPTSTTTPDGLFFVTTTISSEDSTDGGDNDA